VTELTVRGVYFKNQGGRWIESHGGTPGVELNIEGVSVLIDHREVSLLARSIERLGTSGRNSVTIRAHHNQSAAQ
jgi:hypothetical protein